MDAYDGVGDLDAIIRTTIGIYANSIKMAQERTKSRVYVITPLMRPHPTWIKDKIKSIQEQLRSKFEGLVDVELLPTIPIPEQLFEADKIHLNQLGLSMLHAHLMAVCSVFKRIGSVSRASVSDETAHEHGQRKRMASPARTSQPSKKTTKSSREMDIDEISEDDDNVTVTIKNDQQSSVINVIRETMAMELAKFTNAQAKTNKQVSTNFKLVSKELFLHGEDIDAAKNQANSNVILVTGLKGVLPRERHAKNNLASKTAHDFTKEIGAGRIQIMYSTFIPGPPPQPGCLPMLKIACGSQGDAHQIRTCFNSERRTKPQEYSQIYLTPEQEKSTRVRSAVLMALCRKTELQAVVRDAKPTVNRYEFKPDICFRNPKTGKIERRMSYYEAMERFGRLLNGDDLVIPRKIAGKSFPGRMMTLFMLTES